MVTDPIGDFIIRIKNAQNQGLSQVCAPYSKIKHNIADVLVSEGYAKSVAKRGKKVKKILELNLIYKDSKPRINGVKRVSKPSKRIYRNSKELAHPKEKGVLIVSTPVGVVTAKQASQKRVGGEVLCSIW